MANLLGPPVFNQIGPASGNPDESPSTGLGIRRNPIYLGMFLGQIGLILAFNSLWLLMTLVPFVLVIRYSVVAREEAYLARKFNDAYRDYYSRVRRWL